MKRHLRRMAKLVPLGLPLTVALAWGMDRAGFLPTCWQQPLGEREVTIARVIDGDTFVDGCDRHYRVVGMDAPEMDTRWGPSAREAAQRWLMAGPVTVAICSAQPRDRYDRILARAWPAEETSSATHPSGLDLSRTLLRQGWAYPLSIPPCGLAGADAGRQAMAAARSNRRGLWSETATSAVPPEIAARQADRYTVVQGTVKSVRQQRNATVLVLSTQGDARFEVRLDDVRYAALKQRGVTAPTLTGRRIRAEGLVKHKKGKSWMWVENPDTLRYAETEQSGQ